MCVCCWFKTTSITTRQAIISRDNGPTSNFWDLMIDDAAGTGGNGQLRFRYTFSTTSATAVSATGTLTANTWYFGAGLIDASNVCTLYVGTTPTNIVEPSYATRTTGVGAHTNSAQNFTIGNWEDDALPFGGDICHVGILQRTVTLTELKDIAAGYWKKEFPEGFWHVCGNASPEYDQSPNRNSGLVTGTSKVDHAPYVFDMCRAFAPPHYGRFPKQKIADAVLSGRM